MSVCSTRELHNYLVGPSSPGQPAHSTRQNQLAFTLHPQSRKIHNMEASSPLAAMQPSSAFLGVHCGLRADAPTSYPNYAAIKSFGPNSFNFRDLSMKRSRADYFNMQPVRGSSPTASLAADLSQNFHIDQRYFQVSSTPSHLAHRSNSPQLPTPRRALFATQVLGGLNGRGMTD
jgi:M-phase inducer tyrosine phosphatase